MKNKHFHKNAVKVLSCIVLVLTMVVAILPNIGIKASAKPATLGNCRMTYTNGNKGG